MVLHDHLLKLLEQLGRLGGTELVDVMRKWTNGEDTLPPRHRVRANNGMDGLQIPTDVLGIAPWLCVNFHVFGVRCSSIQESTTNERGRQALEELLIWF